MEDLHMINLLELVHTKSDVQAFKKIYFLFYNKLFQLALFYVKSHEVAEEIVDDVFVNIWEKRETLKDVKNFAAYIYVATKNHYLKYNSKTLGRIFIDLDERGVHLVDSGPNPEMQINVKDMDQFIQNLINGLPEKCQLVFRLIREDHMKYKEVAQLLNISIKTVEYHMGVAVNKLSQLNYFAELKSNEPKINIFQRP